MKKLLLLLACCLSLSGVAQSTPDSTRQSRRPHTRMVRGKGRPARMKPARRPVFRLTAEQLTARMAKRYDLSEKQTTKLLQLNRTYQEKAVARPDGQGIATGTPKMRMITQNKLPRGKAKAPCTCGRCPSAPFVRSAAFFTWNLDASQQKEYDAKVKKILKKKQFAKYQKDRKRRMPALRKPGGKGRR